MRRLQHRNFGLGLLSDYSASEIPEGGLQTATNWLVDRQGRARARSGTASLNGSASTPVVDYLLGLRYSDAGGSTQRLYGSGPGGLYGISETSGALTSVYVPSGSGSRGRPFTHNGVGMFPGATPAMAAGTPAGGAGVTMSAAGAICTAGSPYVTGLTTTTGVQRGDIVVIATGAVFFYYGRVTNVTSGTSIAVSPAPSAATAGANAVTLVATILGTAGTRDFDFTARCGCSWQNRAVWGIDRATWSLSGSPVESFVGRMIYSILPGELQVVTTEIFAGMPAMSFAGYPKYNYFDVSGVRSAIIGCEPISQNELMMWTESDCWRTTGILTTNRATLAGQYAQRTDRAADLGCLDARTIQRTPIGVIFASRQGVYSYQNGGFRALMNGKVEALWQSSVGNSTRFGGVYVPRYNHYEVSLDATTFILNLKTGAWTLASGPSMLPYDSAQLPSDPTQTVVALYDASLGSASSRTGGSIVRHDSIFVPGGTATDSDGTTPTSDLKTPLWGDGGEGTRRRYLDAVIDYQSAAKVTVNIGAGEGDASNVNTDVTTQLGATTILAISAVTNATPIVVTTATHNFVTGQMLRILGATGAGSSTLNGSWKITVLSGTTFSLNGSSGTGAPTLGAALAQPSRQGFIDLARITNDSGIQFGFVAPGAGSEIHAVSYRAETLEVQGAVV